MQPVLDEVFDATLGCAALSHRRIKRQLRHIQLNFDLDERADLVLGQVLGRDLWPRYSVAAGGLRLRRLEIEAHMTAGLEIEAHMTAGLEIEATATGREMRGYVPGWCETAMIKG